MRMQLSKRDDKLYSVITGDIIKSSTLSTDEMKRLVNILRNSSKKIKSIFPDSIINDVNIFRGDGWQVLVKKPSLALRISLFYRASLKSEMENDKVNTRMAISIGTIKDFPKRNGSTGIGEAFTLSGKTADKMGKNRLCFASNFLEHQNIDIIFDFIDFLSSKWTSSQSTILLFAFSGMNQTQIADKLSITQQTVSGLLNASGWYVIEKGIRYYENYIDLALNNTK